MRKLSRHILLAILLGALLWVILEKNQRRVPAASPPAPIATEEAESFRILLGLTDTFSTRWDGTISIRRGTVALLEPWRLDADDKLEGSSRWKLRTHEARAFGADARPGIVANGVVATFKNLSNDSEVRVKTAQGKFKFRPAELAYGRAAKFLKGRVRVDRVPASTQVTSQPGEHDFPAAATDREGNFWVAYMKFAPNPKFPGIRVSDPQPPKNLDELAEPTGGDQIFLLRYSQGAWSEPVAVTEAHGDLYKPAVAVDGTGRVWVFWSANSNGNFDLYARSFESGKPGKTLRLTTDPGPDITPAAATDSQGRVWVAWQAFRNGRGEIHSVREQGEGFSSETVVASSSANEWNPAIAAAPSGEVSIAWDTYRNGNYDVYMRTFDASGEARPERAVAASARYEAYPSLAYDASGRLWIAWEESGESWGKDWGAYETSGSALYQGRSIRVKVLQGDRFFTPADVGAVLPGAPNRNVDSGARQSDPQKGMQPDAELWKARQPNRASTPPPRPLNSFPRLLADASGRVWLAFRTAQPIWWSNLGGVWFEYVTSYDGSAWTNPVFIYHSDNILDNRPALVSTAGGELLVVGSADGRQQFPPVLRGLQRPVYDERIEKDTHHNELYASRISFPQPAPARLGGQAAKLDPAPAKAGLPVSASEAADIRRLRDYRARINGIEYRILRGEFHRHTEISHDGRNDGALWDAWRYSLDAAALDWIGCCDHDNGLGREYSWWMNQKLDDIFLLPGVFTPMFNYERSIPYPEGHRNVIMAQRGVRTLPRLPKVDENTPGGAPDTRLLYSYLRHFNGIVGSHTSATNMGTDWRDNDALSEPVVEIYQGMRQNYEMADAPRSNNANDSIGGFRPKGYVSVALEKGYVLGFEASSDHVSTHMSYCNLYTTGTTREDVLEALKKRRVYAATDNILADVRSGEHMMGEQLETRDLPALDVKLIGTAPFAKVHVIKDSRYVYTAQPNAREVEFNWRDTAAEAGKTAYYYVRGEQQDGELVWASPMWITYRPR